MTAALDDDLTFEDLFCGAGGSIRGLVDAGFKLVLGVDRSPAGRRARGSQMTDRSSYAHTKRLGDLEAENEQLRDLVKAADDDADRLASALSPRVADCCRYGCVTCDPSRGALLAHDRRRQEQSR